MWASLLFLVFAYLSPASTYVCVTIENIVIFSSWRIDAGQRAWIENIKEEKIKFQHGCNHFLTCPTKSVYCFLSFLSGNRQVKGWCKSEIFEFPSTPRYLFASQHCGLSKVILEVFQNLNRICSQDLLIRILKFALYLFQLNKSRKSTSALQHTKFVSIPQVDFLDLFDLKGIEQDCILSSSFSSFAL